ncbi:hypothetical protein, partial [Actinocorallia aurea]
PAQPGQPPYPPAGHQAPPPPPPYRADGAVAGGPPRPPLTARVRGFLTPGVLSLLGAGLLGGLVGGGVVAVAVGGDDDHDVIRVEFDRGDRGWSGRGDRGEGGRGDWYVPDQRPFPVLPQMPGEGPVPAPTQTAPQVIPSPS